MKTISKDQFLSSVQQKLGNLKPLLLSGGMDDNRPSNLRDDMGVAMTFSNVLTVSENLYDQRRGLEVDSMAQAICNFSNAGLADVTDVKTVGAIDVTILSMATSLVPFLCVDRGMSNPEDTIYYSNLVATRAGGGLTEGQIADGNFLPPNSSVNLGPADATLSFVAAAGSGASGTVLAFGQPLLPGNVTVSIIISAVTYVGQDFGRDGVIYFKDGAVTQSVTVDYVTGEVTTTDSIIDGDTMSSVVTLDVTQDSSATEALRVKADYVSTQLTTGPKNIIYEQNAHSAMYMQRILDKAATVGGLDYTSLHFNRVMQIYVEDINRDVLKALVSAAAVGGQSVTAESLVPYNTGLATASAGAKNDRVSRFIIDMRTEFLSATGVAPTVIVTGTKGSAELENHPTKFVKNTNFYGVLNGLVGYFDGMPLFRHNYLDSIEGGSTASYYMGTKVPDNSSGTLAFGEYLPLTQTAAVGNFDNPVQTATGFFSQVGTKAIQTSLAKKGILTLA